MRNGLSNPQYIQYVGVVALSYKINILSNIVPKLKSLEHTNNLLVHELDSHRIARSGDAGTVVRSPVFESVPCAFSRASKFAD